MRQTRDVKIFEVQVHRDRRELGHHRRQSFARAQRVRGIEADADAFRAGGLDDGAQCPGRKPVVVFETQLQSVQQRLDVAQRLHDVFRRGMEVRSIDHKTNQLRPHAPGQRRHFGDMFNRQPTGTDLDLHAFIRRTVREAGDAFARHPVQRKIVADLHKLHRVTTGAIEQVLLVHRARGFVARHADGPAVGVAADAEFHPSQGYLFVMSRTCSRMSDSSKIFCQPSLKSTGLARLLIL